MPLLFPERDPVARVLISDFFTSLISDIDQAKVEIIGSVYLFTGFNSSRLTDPIRLLNSLKKARARGVNVFLLINQRLDYARPKREHRKLSEALKMSGIEFQLYPRSKIQHAKIFLIDGGICFVGSHNLTQGAVSKNLDVTVRYEDRELYSDLAFSLLSACAPPFPVRRQEVAENSTDSR